MAMIGPLAAHPDWGCLAQHSPTTPPSRPILTEPRITQIMGLLTRVGQRGGRGPFFGPRGAPPENVASRPYSQLKEAD